MPWQLSRAYNDATDATSEKQYSLFCYDAVQYNSLWRLSHVYEQREWYHGAFLVYVLATIEYDLKTIFASKGSDYDLPPSRRQASIWTNNTLGYLQIFASLGLSELKTTWCEDFETFKLMRMVLRWFDFLRQYFNKKQMMKSQLSHAIDHTARVANKIH